MGDPTAADSEYADNHPLYHADAEGGYIHKRKENTENRHPKLDSDAGFPDPQGAE